MQGMQVRGVPSGSSTTKEATSALEEYCTKTLDYDVRCMLYVEEDREMHFAEFDGAIITMSVETGTIAKRFQRKCDCIWGLAAVRDELWAACSDGDLIAYHRQSGKVLQKWQGHMGGTFCVASQGDKVIRFVTESDISVEKEKGQYKGRTRGYERIQYSQFDSGGADWVIRVWSAHSSLTKCYFGHTNAVRCLLVVDNTLWSGADDRSIRVWPLDTTETECLQELQGHTDSVLCMCKCDTISPPTVWSSGADQTIRVWDGNYRCTHKLKSHKGWVTGLVVAGRTVWSSSADKTIVIWDNVNLRVKKTLRDHGAYLRGITCANYQVVSFAADRSIRFWHCTELYKGLVGKIQREVTSLTDKLLDKGKREGEMRVTLVNCYSTIETLEREVDTRKQATKERDELKANLQEITSKLSKMEKDTIASLAHASASQEKIFTANFNTLMEIVEADTAAEACANCLLAIQKLDQDVSQEKAKLMQATKKVEELQAKQVAQTESFSTLETVWMSRTKELEGQVAREKARGLEDQDALKKKEQGFLEREREMKATLEKLRGASSANEATAGLALKIQELESKYATSLSSTDALTRQIKELQEDNKGLLEKLAAADKEVKSVRRRSKKEKENVIRIDEYTKLVADLEDQLAAAKAAPKAPPEESLTSDRLNSKMRELEEAVALAQKERGDVARDYARRAIELEGQILRAQQEGAEYAKRCKELEAQVAKFERAGGYRDDISMQSGVSTLDDNPTSVEVNRLTEEVETLNAEKRWQKQEIEEALRSKAELEKEVESLKLESMIKSNVQKPQSAIQALLDKTHRLEAQLTQAHKDNAALQKYQKDAQKQAELKQMMEGMISKVLDMETRLIEVTKERDELTEELTQFKSAGLIDREDKQKLYSMQLVLNQTRAQNTALDSELKTVKEKLKREEEEGAKARVACEHLTVRVAGLEELLKKMGNISAERSAIPSFY